MNLAKLILAGAAVSSLAYGQLIPVSATLASKSADKPAPSAEKLFSALFLEDATTDGKFGKYLPKLGAELASALNKNGVYAARPEDHFAEAEPVEGQNAAMFRVQIARDLGATCYMTATVLDFDRVEIATGVFDLSLGLALNVYGAARGDGVYGDTVTVTGRATAQQLARSGEAAINSLLKSAASQMAVSFANGMSDNVLKSRPAAFRIDCNVPATVLIDGAARGELGENGVRTIETGLHTIEVVDNPDWPYYRPFKTRVFIENGARFNVTLYLNDKGVERFKRVNDWILSHRKEIDALLLQEANQNMDLAERAAGIADKEADRALDRTQRAGDIAHRKDVQDVEVRARRNEVTQKWIAFTNSVALNTYVTETNVRNGNKIVASSLSNGEKLVDAAIEDQKADRSQVWRRIEVGHSEEMSRIAGGHEERMASIGGDVAKAMAENDTELAQSAMDHAERIHAIDADVEKAKAAGFVEVDVARAEGTASVGIAEAQAKGEVGKAEVQRRIDEENHNYMKPVVEGVSSQLRNSWSRLEDTHRLLEVSTRSEGDGIATVDYDPEEETTINLENKGSRKQK